MSEEISEFVTKTLNAVIRAVDEANFESITPSNQIVARKTKGGGMFLPKEGKVQFSIPCEVHFDVAVSATTNETADGGFDLKIVKAAGGIKSENANSSRVSFTIEIERMN